MPITDDLRAIADRVNRDLDAVHNFFEQSKLVWRSFQLLVDAGHTISAENLATGTHIDQAGLMALAPRYTREYLATFAFREFVAAFESFFFALFGRVLQHNPWPLARSQLDFEAVLRARDRDEIISGVIHKRLNEVKYQGLRDWFDALNKAVRLDCPTEEDIDMLAEVKAARDILEHNAGIVNDVYVRKAGRKARYTVGENVEIDDNYHLESWRLIKKVVMEITNAALGRLAQP
jgi:hypothetical protein